MAEVIAALGVAASVAQLADYGFKLSIKLFSYSQVVSQADASIKGISNDVSLTSTVLQELCGILKSDETHIVSSSAVEATQQTVKECLQIFEQLSGALDKSLGSLGIAEKGKAKKGRVALAKLKWPFKQPKMELLRSNLDRLKASLTLMLQVLSYARSISSRKEMESSFEYQKHLIESLARSERATRRKHYDLQMAIEGKGTDENFDVTISNSVVTRSKDPDLENLESKPLSEVKPKLLIGELLLCFQLLNELLRAYLEVSKDTEGSSAIYKEFNFHLERLSQTELQRLKKEHAGTSTTMRAEAVGRLQTRLCDLAKASGSVLKNGTAVLGTNGQIEQLKDSRYKNTLVPMALDDETLYGRPSWMRSSVDDQPRKRLWYRVLDNISRKTTKSDPASHKTSSNLPDLAPKDSERLSSHQIPTKFVKVAEMDEAVQAPTENSRPTIFYANEESYSKRTTGKPTRDDTFFSTVERPRDDRPRSEDEDGEGDMPENIVQNLLSKWTTLPSQEQNSVIQNSE